MRYEIEKLETQADEAGWAAGVPFTDSKGVRQLEPEPGTANLVDSALNLYKKGTRPRLRLRREDCLCASAGHTTRVSVGTVFVRTREDGH